MAIEIALVIEGVNLLSDEFDEQVLPKFPDVQWESRAGATLAILHVDSSPVEAACTFSRILEHSGLGAVTAVFDDFVNTTEIAQRVDVSRELVRNWVLGSRVQVGSPAASRARHRRIEGPDEGLELGGGEFLVGPDRFGRWPGASDAS